MPVEIIGCPIVRESGGLAFSSRNKLLSEQARNEANIIYTTLLAAKIKFGTKSAKYVMNWVIKEFKKLPQFNLEYISITNATNLTPVSRKRKNVKYRAFIAVYAEGVRLIDNIALN
jgi:pantoate--beta-alanine ligase